MMGTCFFLFPSASSTSEVYFIEFGGLELEAYNDDIQRRDLMFTCDPSTMNCVLLLVVFLSEKCQDCPDCHRLVTICS